MINLQEAHDILDRWYPGKPLTRVEQLEAQINRLQRDLRELQNQSAEDSWRLNPDRMGGAFSQDEIDRARGDTWI